jgi:hypothetical protein
MARDTVRYRVQLGSAHEQVKLVQGYPGPHRSSEYPAVLYRFGTPIVGFFLTKDQLAKVRAGSGRIQISGSQIERYGRSVGAGQRLLRK